MYLSSTHALTCKKHCFVLYISSHAGTGLKEAVTLLEGMLNDNTDFVRQGASIAMALVLLQQPESVVEPFRKKVRGRAQPCIHTPAVQVWMCGQQLAGACKCL